MRRYLFAAVALTLGLSAGAFAQGGGIGGGTGIGGGGGLGGGSGIGGGSGGFGGGSGGFGGGTGLSGGTAFGGGSGGMGLTGGTGFGGGTGGAGGRAGGIGGGAGGSGAFQMSAQNPFTSWYASPLYYGRPGATSTTMGQPGQQLKGAGFGQPSFGNVTAARTATTTGTTGRGGTATVNRGMTGGLGGANNQMPEVSYAATVRFPAPPLAVTAVRADLQGLLDRSSALSRPGRVRVEADGNVIVLRGRVADEDEKRLVEGMVRLEPGVQAVRNELEVGP